MAATERLLFFLSLATRTYLRKIAFRVDNYILKSRSFVIAHVSTTPTIFVQKIFFSLLHAQWLKLTELDPLAPKQVLYLHSKSLLRNAAINWTAFIKKCSMKGTKSRCHSGFGPGVHIRWRIWRPLSQIWISNNFLLKLQVLRKEVFISRYVMRTRNIHLIFGFKRSSFLIN